MNKKEIIELVRKHCGPAGLNLIRVIDSETADKALAGPIKSGHLLAGARSLIVLGNYASAMWEALQADIEGNREKYDAINDPIDTFTSHAIENAVSELSEKGINAQGLYPWRQEASGFLPFQAWGIAAGFGVMSLVGVVLHPEYGPWNSFRGAILVDAQIEPDPSCTDFNPCADCKAPCIDACPSGAVSKEGCDIQKCLRARLFEENCETRCEAREACIYGKEHIFSRDEITYHSFTGLQNIRRMMGH